MDILIYIGFALFTFGPLVAYAIYTSLRGEPRRPDKPSKGKGSKLKSVTP